MKPLVAIMIFLVACNSKPKVQQTRSVKELDSLIEIQKANSVLPKEVFNDTIGISKAPVKILSAKLYKKEYTAGKSIKVVFKNVSDKNVDGVRFHWMITGTWGIEDVGRYASLRTDETVRKGETQTYYWDIQSEGKKVHLIWPHEVVFSDGTSWNLKEQ